MELFRYFAIDNYTLKNTNNTKKLKQLINPIFERLLKDINFSCNFDKLQPNPLLKKYECNRDHEICERNFITSNNRLFRQFRVCNLYLTQYYFQQKLQNTNR